MPKFIFVARGNTGEKITGAEEAASSEELTTRLQARNLLVVSIIPEALGSAPISKQKAPAGRLSLRHYRVTHDELVLFCRQLATLLGAGVTIMKSLEIISKQVTSRQFYDVLQEL
ncbi:MAG: hypothetical protein NT066_07970, partial [Candidatus Omnitrophica bacterium]|nr:hypothetical protein [Candidatus Omnitrophota bacterium]